jgi:hypothetical protein
MSPKYDNISTSFVELEVHAIGKQAFRVLPGIPCCCFKTTLMCSVF